MTLRNIKFKKSMFEALLSGAKTQTRRILKDQPTFSKPFTIQSHRFGWDWVKAGKEPWPLGRVDVPYRTGEKLWAVDPSGVNPLEGYRLLLTLTDVKVHQIQDISIEDILREGVFPKGILWKADDFLGPSPRTVFLTLWNDIYGPSAWHDNPWVVALSFYGEKVDET
jgi:hypothetical protein